MERPPYRGLGPYAAGRQLDTNSKCLVVARAMPAAYARRIGLLRCAQYDRSTGCGKTRGEAKNWFIKALPGFVLMDCYFSPGNRSLFCVTVRWILARLRRANNLVWPVPRGYASLTPGCDIVPIQGAS